MRRTGASVTVVIAACVLATTVLPLGCGNDDNNNSGPTPTPVPTSTSGATPTPLPTSGATPTPTLTPLPSPTVVVITVVQSVATLAGLDVGASDSGFLVAYGTYGAAPTATSTSSIYGVRLDGDGEVVDPTPFVISVAQSGGFLDDPSWTAPAVGFDGASYAVAYAGTGTEGGFPAAAITAVLVDPQASVGVPTDLAETGSFGMCQTEVGPPPALAGTPAASFAALWPFMAGCINVPVVDRLDGALATPQGAALSVSELQGLLPPFDQTPLQTSAASVASSATTTVAAWRESASGPDDAVVELALLAPGGVERTQLANGGGGFTRPAIASDGSDYLVVWQAASNSIRGARFRPGTGPLDGPDGFLIAQAQLPLAPRVAFGNGRYLVAFFVVGASFSQLRTFEVSPAGAVTAIETGAGQAAALGSDAAVAFSNGTFVVPFWEGGALRAVLIRP